MGARNDAEWRGRSFIAPDVIPAKAEAHVLSSDMDSYFRGNDGNGLREDGGVGCNEALAAPCTTPAL